MMNQSHKNRVSAYLDMGSIFVWTLTLKNQWFHPWCFLLHFWNASLN